MALGRAHPTAPLLEPGGSQEKTPWNMQGLLRRGAAGGWTRGCQALGRAGSRGLMSWHGSRRDEGVRVSSIPESLSPASGAGAGAAGSVTPPRTEGAGGGSGKTQRDASAVALEKGETSSVGTAAVGLPV